MTIDALLQLVTTAKIINTTKDGDRQIEIKDGSGELVGRFWSFESDLEWSLDQCFDHIQNKHPELICEEDHTMSKLAEVQKSIVCQWEKMIKAGRVPVLEYQIGEDDFLQVDIDLVDNGSAILFSFDRRPFPTANVWFSGEVVPVLNNFQITIDEYTDKLDIYLQQIDQEMLEGFILPNGLYYCED